MTKDKGQISFLITLSILSGLFSLTLPATAITFDFTFDDVTDSDINDAQTGSGTFSFDGVPNDGTFNLDNQTGVDFNFTFPDLLIGAPTVTFTENDLTSTNVNFTINTIGSDRFVIFDGLEFTQPVLVGAGTINESLILNPSSLSVPSIGDYVAENITFNVINSEGNYQGVSQEQPPTTAVPLETKESWGLVALGLLVLYRSYKKRTQG
jgi:hypothetical protein